MNRWVVFNRFTTYDGSFFHVYVDADHAAGAVDVAVKVFEYMAEQNALGLGPDFVNPELMTALRVSQ